MEHKRTLSYFSEMQNAFMLVSRKFTYSRYLAIPYESNLLPLFLSLFLHKCYEWKNPFLHIFCMDQFPSKCYVDKHLVIHFIAIVQVGVCRLQIYTNRSYLDGSWHAYSRLDSTTTQGSHWSKGHWSGSAIFRCALSFIGYREKIQHLPLLTLTQTEETHLSIAVMLMKN